MTPLRRAATAAILLLAVPASAQVSGTNLLEFQNGNIPFNVPENRYDLYDQLNLEYRATDLRLGLRFESDRSSDNTFTYDEITQRWAEWSERDFRIRAGNFYTILGRGLLHRSFELPGVVLDQPGLRSRYAPSRDVDGVLADGSFGPLAGRAFAGSPNVGDTSPGLEPVGLERYRGQIAGGQAAATLPRGAKVGAAYLRNTDDGVAQNEFGSGFADVDLLKLFGVSSVALPVYVEHAVGGSPFSDWWSFDTGDSAQHALYAGMNLLVGNWALSAEWKDYADFRLGPNDPPSLVREQSWPLLNRATHVLDAGSEQGYQIEASGRLRDGVEITGNLSRSDGNLTGRIARFDERYVELHVAPGERWEASVFYDTGKDEFFFYSDRDVYGGGGTFRVTSEFALAADIERQHAVRGGESFTDQYYSATVSRAERGSLGIVWERTSDPQEQPDEPDGRYRDFVAGVGSLRITDRHDLAVLYGERRGGRACTAGTCYDVLSFKGLEVRLTSRF